MSGHTPVAMSWSTARKASTATPCLSMMARLTSTRPCVCDCSGLGLSVQLMKSALRPSKRKAASSEVIGFPFLGLGEQIGESIDGASYGARVSLVLDPRADHLQVEVTGISGVEDEPEEASEWDVTVAGHDPVGGVMRSDDEVAHLDEPDDVLA